MPIDMSQLKAPTRKPATAKKLVSPALPVADTQSINDKRVEALAGFAQLGQGLSILFGNYADAAAIGMHGEKICTELVNVATMDERLTKYMDTLILTGPYLGLVTALVPFALQIAANHGWRKGNLMGGGVVPPEVLEAQMKASVAHQQAQAALQHQQAIKQAQDAQREYERIIAESQNTVS